MSLTYSEFAKFLLTQFESNFSQIKYHFVKMSLTYSEFAKFLLTQFEPMMVILKYTCDSCKMMNVPELARWRCLDCDNLDLCEFCAMQRPKVALPPNEEGEILVHDPNVCTMEHIDTVGKNIQTLLKEMMKHCPK